MQKTKDKSFEYVKNNLSLYIRKKISFNRGIRKCSLIIEYPMKN